MVVRTIVTVARLVVEDEDEVMTMSLLDLHLLLTTTRMKVLLQTLLLLQKSRVHLEQE